MPQVFHMDNLPLALREVPLPQFRWHSTGDLAQEAGAARLHLNMRSLDPGAFSYPYHFHRKVEEVFVVLSGEATLRTPEGFQAVRAGDVAIFETGPSSAHQLYNHAAAPCRYLDLTTIAEVDVCEYPDTGKVLVLPYRLLYGPQGPTDYFAGEERVADHWPAELIAGRQQP